MKKSVCFMTLAVLGACLTPALAQDQALIQAARKEGQSGLVHFAGASVLDGYRPFFQKNIRESKSRSIARARSASCSGSCRKRRRESKMWISFIPPMPAILSCSKTRAYCCKFTPKASGRFPAGFKDKRWVLLRHAGDAVGDRLQSEDSGGQGCAEDLEGSIESQVERQRWSPLIRARLAVMLGIELAWIVIFAGTGAAAVPHRAEAVQRLRRLTLSGTSWSYVRLLGSLARYTLTGDGVPGQLPGQWSSRSSGWGSCSPSTGPSSARRTTSPAGRRRSTCSSSAASSR